MSVEFGVLGPVVATVDGSPARLGGTRQRAVLASLLLRGPQVVPVTRIIDDVWSTEPPDSAANLVQGYVSALRKVLGARHDRDCGAGLPAGGRSQPGGPAAVPACG